MALSQPAKRKFNPSSSSASTTPIPTNKKSKSDLFAANAAMAGSSSTLGATATTGLRLLDEPVNYRDLRAWLEEQELDPKPLSPLQQRAIADLRRSMEPKTDDCDWVSLLNSRHSLFCLKITNQY